MQNALKVISRRRVDDRARSRPAELVEDRVWCGGRRVAGKEGVRAARFVLCNSKESAGLGRQKTPVKSDDKFQSMDYLTIMVSNEIQLFGGELPIVIRYSPHESLNDHPISAKPSIINRERLWFPHGSYQSVPWSQIYVEDATMAVVL